MLGDLELEDLRRALINAVDARIAEEAFGIVFGEIPRAAVDLHHAVDHPAAHLASEDLERGGLDEDVLAPVGARGDVGHHALRGVDLDLAVGEHRLDQLEVGDRLAEGLALVGVAQRRIERAPGVTGRRRADRDAPVVEALHRKDEALAGLAAEQCITRHAHIVEHDVGDVAARLAHLFVGRAARDAGAVHRHDKGADMRVLGQGLLAGARHDQRDIGVGCVGDVALCTVKDPSVPVRIGDSGSLETGGIAARARFGQTEAGDAAFRDLGIPLGLLGFCSAILQRAREHPDVDREDRAVSGRGIGHDVHDAGVLRHVEPRAAVFLGHRETEQAHLAHFLEDLIGDAVLGDHLRLGREQPFADIAGELLGELLEGLLVHSCVVRSGEIGGGIHRHDP